ncbi:unnamed protein product [Rotaria sordida]|uniref:Uncharacterized protein n=1 Tax=Rotaria sordida TaxID=392033 RepID=A0A819END2_9BILA|nr:unnamed protein product [Rotaria sordida]CAF3853574.1 unnamed protein product [Rotaria sordida]
MSSGPKVSDIEEENILSTKIKLTKNEFNATVRNKLEYNRLKVIKRHIGYQNDMSACKMRTSIHDLRKWLDDNQRVVCNIDEFFTNRKIQSATPHYRSRLPGVRSSFTHPNDDRYQNRAKSASTISRPYTAPLQTIFEQQRPPDQVDTESDDEIIPISISRLTSGKRSVARSSSAVSNSVMSQHPVETNINNVDITSSTVSSVSHRITWPVKLKVFALQDEDVARQQYLAWRAEQRKSKVKHVPKTFFDNDLERKYQESIRRRQDIEAYVTPELVQEHKLNDPIFAKRYRQLKLALRAGKIPSYDPNDCEINITMTKSKIERARSALITAKQSKIKTYYQNQQNVNDTQLSKRIETFLKGISEFKEEQENKCSI